MDNYTLADLLEGKSPTLSDELNEEWKGDEEGNAKLQKVIRKRIQFLDDPETPFGYRANKKGTLDHLLTWEFPDKEGDKRKGPKSAEHLDKMKAARGKKPTMKEYMEQI
jgi:hypothetical protein